MDLVIVMVRFAGVGLIMLTLVIGGINVAMCMERLRMHKYRGRLREYAWTDLQLTVSWSVIAIMVGSVGIYCSFMPRFSPF